MRRVDFSPAARDDLNEIWEYIAARNLSAADRMVRRLETAACELSAHPGIGHVRADVPNPDYRFRVVRPYLIAYQHDDESVTIVRIVHGARDFRRIFRKPRT